MKKIDMVKQLILSSGERGYSKKELTEKVGCCTATVERATCSLLKKGLLAYTIVPKVIYYRSKKCSPF